MRLEGQYAALDLALQALHDRHDHDEYRYTQRHPCQTNEGDDGKHRAQGVQVAQGQHQAEVASQYLHGFSPSISHIAPSGKPKDRQQPRLPAYDRKNTPLCPRFFILGLTPPPLCGIVSLPSGLPGGKAGKPRQDREVATVFGPCLSGVVPAVSLSCEVSLQRQPYSAGGTNSQRNVSTPSV